MKSEQLGPHLEESYLIYSLLSNCWYNNILMSKERWSVGPFHTSAPSEHLDISHFYPYAALLETNLDIFAAMRSRYEVMKAQHMSCFQAVGIWKYLQENLPGFVLSDTTLQFSTPIQDSRRYTHTGQIMLQIQRPHLPTVLVMDVAGYLFGFEYQDIFVGIGTNDGIGTLATTHYGQ